MRVAETMAIPDSVLGVFELAITEWWVTPDTPLVEQYPLKWPESPEESPLAYQERAIKTPKLRNRNQIRYQSDGGNTQGTDQDGTGEDAPGQNPGRPTSWELRNSPLYWLMYVSDPVRLGLHDLNGDGLFEFLEASASEITRKLEVTTDSNVFANGREMIRRRRPRDPRAIRDALVGAFEDTPQTRWAIAAACTVLEVGLVVETPWFADCFSWNDRVAWVRRKQGVECLKQDDARLRLAAMAASLVRDPTPPMASLREASIAFGVEKPLKKSRVGMVEDLVQKISQPRTFEFIVDA